VGSSSVSRQSGYSDPTGDQQAPCHHPVRRAIDRGEPAQRVAVTRVAAVELPRSTAA